MTCRGCEVARAQGYARCVACENEASRESRAVTFTDEVTPDDEEHIEPWQWEA